MKPPKKMDPTPLFTAMERDSNILSHAFSNVFMYTNGNPKYRAVNNGMVTIHKILKEKGGSVNFFKSKSKQKQMITEKETNSLLTAIDEMIIKETFTVQLPAEHVDLPFENPLPSQILGTGTFGDVIKGKLYFQKLAFKHLSIKNDISKRLPLQARGEIIYELQQNWRNFSHPNILKLFGLIVIEEVYFLAFERMGVSLHQVLHGTSGPQRNSAYQLKKDEIITVAKGIINGIQFLHDKGILFCGLHPRNVLLRHGVKQNMLKLNPDDVKVSDFGVNFLKDSLNFENPRMGAKKDAYLAPEVFKYASWTMASDVYSFGLIWWEMTEFDKVPLEGISDVYTSVVEKRFRPKFDQTKSRAGSMKPIIEECWANDPHKRPTVQALKRYFEKRQVQ